MLKKPSKIKGICRAGFKTEGGSEYGGLVSTLNSRAISSTGKLCPNVLTYHRRHLLPSTLYMKMCACQTTESKDVLRFDNFKIS